MDKIFGAADLVAAVAPAGAERIIRPLRFYQRRVVRTDDAVRAAQSVKGRIGRVCAEGSDRHRLAHGTVFSANADIQRAFGNGRDREGLFVKDGDLFRRHGFPRRVLRADGEGSHGGTFRKDDLRRFIFRRHIIFPRIVKKDDGIERAFDEPGIPARTLRARRRRQQEHGEQAGDKD